MFWYLHDSLRSLYEGCRFVILCFLLYDQVSPIEFGYVLLIPHVLDCFPQRIDHKSFLLALYLAKQASDPFFRVGYNSLGA